MFPTKFLAASSTAKFVKDFDSHFYTFLLLSTNRPVSSGPIYEAKIRELLGEAKRHGVAGYAVDRINQVLRLLAEPEKPVIQYLCRPKQAGKTKAMLAKIKEIQPCKIEIIEPHGWIPVSEGLPEETEWVLVYQDEAVRCRAWSAERKEWQDWDKSECSGLNMREITHWMPIILPEPELVNSVLLPADYRALRAGTFLLTCAFSYV